MRNAICCTLMLVGFALAAGGAGTVECSGDLMGFGIGAIGVGLMGLAVLVQGY